MNTAPAAGLHQIDMTGHGTQLRMVEIHTDAGIIRVNTNLETVHAPHAPVVTVEIEPNMQGAGIVKTEAGGHWELAVHDRISWTEVKLVRTDAEEAQR